MLYKFCLGATALAVNCSVSLVQADVGHVYHPQVDYLEKEVEYQRLWRDDGVDLQSASFSYAWHPRWSGELYLVKDLLTHTGGKIKAYEAEVKWQLTEQGEYWADWGLLFEAGRSRDISRYETAVGLLWEKDLPGRWIGTINGFVEYEFGSDIESEWETSLSAQLRYRQSPAFEPAFEIYLDDQDYAAGPVWVGQQRFSGRQQLRWELGALLSLNSATPDTQFKLSLEWEF
ncbi:hypothetical protein [uncultured Gilvimarinus sp.]|uniref:hypothetical protein n=1 Tax=uncultured Gilvimarinus sp. TaxID=1689143 RepID=UPI0030DADA4C